MGNRHNRELREASHSNAEGIRNLAIVLRRINTELLETKGKLADAKSNFDDQREMLLMRITEQSEALDTIDAAMMTLHKESATQKDVKKLRDLIKETKEGISKEKNQIPHLVKETISKDKKEWDETVLKIQDGYQKTKAGIRETIAKDLDHERGIYELKKTCEVLNGSKKATDRSSKCISSLEAGMLSENEETEADNYNLQFSKIGLLIKHLKENTKIIRHKEDR